MEKKLLQESIHFLEGFTSEKRIGLLDKNIENRTRYITLVLEDIFQAQNASAVIRSCDCFGVQDLHVIENHNEYHLNPDVVMGASKWMNLHRYNKEERNTLSTITKLKNQGYRIIATSPHSNDILLPDFDLTKGKAAFFFGTELTGLSDEVMNNADEFVKIPMYGFTESFNISVSAAIVLNHLTTELRRSDIYWQLSEYEKLELKLDWLVRSVRSGDELLGKFLKKKQ
ncbi:TrmH family RNA methyltransferase [Labilibaculum sp. A4]|uniref:tRNA (guanosine(18)-2'-O)-methyltransferase n=1 Tax=Labilibaculum euxinus TaxID=2686357 RepID=A0A425YB23_9BACT|nr:RNA methyltransferase [Labilibaculum euxinus]MDQ1771108.1 RNA methyltransferase [Labilibaculum euxinus]MUP36729.1 TrmH family RNA methyltransferase [Labilibaculum euxinus]MVB05934.1 TrmH family RNA methyltransferase [Labilibaculum euxinus]MWN76885.1 TrmH family RNA methyltransferase [Labilibaculum euxinus]